MKKFLHHILLIFVFSFAANTIQAQTEIEIDANGRTYSDAEKSVMDSLTRPHNYDSMRSVVQQQIF